MPKNPLSSIVANVVVATSLLVSPSVAQETPRPSSEASSSTVVLSHWTVRMPFEPDSQDPQAIGKIIDPMWGWMKEGQRVVSVNGMQINRLNALRAMLRLSTNPGDKTQLAVKLGIETDANGIVSEELIILPIVQDTVLKNGMQIESVFDGATWVSTVVKIPEGADTDLTTGDQLVAMSGSPFDMRDSVQKLFQAERRKGTMNYTLSYRRGTVIRTGVINLHDIAPPKNDINLAASKNDMSKVEIMSHWTVRMPFAPLEGSPKRVGASEVASDIGQGDRILSVNGMKVPHINAIPALLRLSTDPGDMTEMKVDFEYKPKNGGPSKMVPVSLQITQDTVLANGMQFETRYNGHRWNTTVMRIPDGVVTDLKLGDHVIGHGDGTAFNSRTGFRDHMREDRRAEKTEFSVIVARGTKIMIGTFAY